MKTLVAMLAACLSIGSGVQPERQDAAAPSAAEAAWSERLGALDPKDPMGCFLLGEDVAATPEAPGARALAQRLFVLAYTLETSSGQARGAFPIGPSACIALASIAQRDEERRWLRALADTMGEGPLGAGDVKAAPAASAWSPEAAFELATAMGLARSGEGRRASILLEKPEVSELLREMDLRPMPDGRPASLKNFLDKAVRDWPACPQCRNRRVVPVGQNRTGEMALCDTCRGNPGPRLTGDELANQLRIESLLLQGEQRSWAAQVLADVGAPLRDLDPSELAGTYGVDPAKVLWRNGGWSPPDAPVPAPEKK